MVDFSNMFAPKSQNVGTGPDSFVLNISQDAFNGNAQFQVFVDGLQVGGTFEASALRSDTKGDVLTLRGHWGDGAHDVSVKFINDTRIGSDAMDRNLFVNSILYNGDPVTTTRANLYSNGTFSSAVAAKVYSQNLDVGTGKDSFVISISQDAYLGNAKYQIFIDGKQVGGTFEAAALRKNGLVDTITLRGDWGEGKHDVSVRYINDARHATDATQDRNLFVNSIFYNGDPVSTSRTNLYSNGTATTEVAAKLHFQNLDVGVGKDNIVLSISQDSYLGNAKYQVFVDGKQIGGTFEATASRKTGYADTITLHGDWGNGAHDISVKYINDTRNMTDITQDRNLYVNSITFNDTVVSSTRANLFSNGAFTATVPASLTGTASNDQIIGGSGDDFIRGGLGNDVLTGGGGHDTFIFYKGDGADRVTDFAANGNGSDIIDLGAFGFSKFDHLASHIKQVGADTIITLNAEDSIKLSNVAASSLTAANFKFSDVAAPSTKPLNVGININGAEYIGPSGQKTGIDYFPTHEEIRYFAAKGMDNLRMPIAWENLQHSLGGALDSAYLAKMHDVVNYAKSLGMEVIIDIHNYGSYKGNLIGSSAVPSSSFADVWSKLAQSFADDSNVIFGLMNEPQQANPDIWLPIVNQAIAAIRATGATQQITVPGVYWDGAFNWVSNGNAAVIGKQGAVVDPLNNFIFEVHQYLDHDTSGSHGTVVSATIGAERLAAITDWARTNGYKLYLGETGVADNNLSLTALDTMMSFLKANEDVWQGVSYWAAGSVWQGNYIFSAQPLMGLLDSAQMDVLEKYVNAEVTRTTLSDGTFRMDVHGYSNGAVSVSDVVDAHGDLVSRTLYEVDGKTAGRMVENGDGTTGLYSYFGNGALSSIRTANADHQLIKEVIYASDGSATSKNYVPGTTDLALFETFNAAGKLVQSTEYKSNGFVISDYADGTIAKSATYDKNWSLMDSKTYYSSGILQQESYKASDGDWLLDNFGANGSLVSHAQFSADWTMESWTNYLTDGTKNMVLMHANGGKDIGYYAENSDTPYKVDHFDVSGNLLYSDAYFLI